LVVLLALGAIGVLLLSQRQASQTGKEAVNEPQAGGLYTEALIGSINRLNPVLDYYNSPDYDIDQLIYSRLVRFDNRGLPHGDLAQDWGISQDGKVYNFAIRPKAVWHDGQPVTSDDVLFTIDLLRSQDLPVPPDVQQFWNQVEVQALDEKTLQFHLPEPFSPFLDYLNFGILPKHLLENISPADLIDAPFNLQPVGSGPYKFQNLVVENGKVTGVALQAFKEYYGAKPFIEKINFKYYPDSATALAAYKQDEVMGISQITPDILPEALKEPALNLFTGRLPNLSLVYLNLNNPQTPFFQDPVVRRALMMGINRRLILDHLLGGQGILANGPIFPENWAYYEGIQQIPYDPDAAVQLLKSAGYTFPASGAQVRSKDGAALSFEMVYPDTEIYTAIAQRIQSDWQKLGVQVKLTPLTYDDMVANYLEKRNYQAALAEMNFDRAPDPDPYPFWHQAQIASGQNYSQWDDRQVSEYLEQARVTVDYAERAKRYRNFQVRFMNELPALPLFYPVYTYAVDQQVKGVSMGPLYNSADRFDGISSWYMVSGPTGKGIPTPTPKP